MSRRSYELSAAARLDLLQLWNYLVENASIAVADKVVADIESAIQGIAQAPRRGHRRTDLTDREILFYLVHSHFIIYRPDKKPLQILRVLHAARDVQHLLNE